MVSYIISRAFKQKSPPIKKDPTEKGILQRQLRRPISVEETNPTSAKGAHLGVWFLWTGEICQVQAGPRGESGGGFRLWVSVGFRGNPSK